MQAVAIADAAAVLAGQPPQHDVSAAFTKAAGQGLHAASRTRSDQQRVLKRQQRVPSQPVNLCKKGAFMHAAASAVEGQQQSREYAAHPCSVSAGLDMIAMV